MADAYWEWQELKPAIGEQMVKEKRLNAAIAYYDDMIRQARSQSAKESYSGADPVVFYRGKAEALAAKGDLDEAIAALRAALDLVEREERVFMAVLRGFQEAEIRESLAQLYERKQDMPAAAHERALAEKARREAERGPRTMVIPISAFSALFLIGAGQWLLVLLLLLVSAIAVAVVGRRDGGAAPRRARWSFREVMHAYLIAFLPPLLIVPGLVVAAGSAADVGWSLGVWLSGVGVVATLVLLMLLIRGGLAREAQATEVVPAQRWRATAALSGWLLLAAGIANGIILVIGGVVTGLLIFALSR